jgi:uncharacterized membrane protein YhaH (DUF805 family)
MAIYSIVKWFNPRSLYLSLQNINLKIMFEWKGRISRKEFCKSFIAYCILGVILSFIPFTFKSYNITIVVGIYCFLVYSLLSFCYILQSVKRCHDLGWSGVTLLIGLIPLLNIVFLFILLFSKGQKEENKYGIVPIYSVQEFL